MDGNPPNPYLAREAGGLVPGTVLDAGCGAGAEAIWLASHGWQVTAADISAEALARAADRSATSGASERVRWVEADLGVWDPGTPFDLVTTHYAHPAMPQLEFYDRIAEWVTPGGALLIVGDLHTHSATGDGHQPPAEASATAAAVTARLDDRTLADHWVLRFCQGQRPSSSTSREKLRKVRTRTMTARTPTLMKVGETATVRMMSPATRNSSPSRIARPRLCR